MAGTEFHSRVRDRCASHLIFGVRGVQLSCMNKTGIWKTTTFPGSMETSVDATLYWKLSGPFLKAVGLGDHGRLQVPVLESLGERSGSLKDWHCRQSLSEEDAKWKRNKRLWMTWVWYLIFEYIWCRCFDRYSLIFWCLWGIASTRVASGKWQRLRCWWWGHCTAGCWIVRAEQKRLHHCQLLPITASCFPPAVRYVFYFFHGFSFDRNLPRRLWA